MSVLSKLASAQQRRDELPNLTLAKEIVHSRDKKPIAELVLHLQDKDKDIQSDCIKVLYEIDECDPSLIREYIPEFATLLSHKNNRLQWGGMAAINTVTLEDPKVVYSFLSEIIAAADRGSVITRDGAVSILIKLCSLPAYAENAFPLLMEQLMACPPNQVPMYAEIALPVLTESMKRPFRKVLTDRLSDIEKDTKRKRVEKVIQKLGK